MNGHAAICPDGKASGRIGKAAFKLRRAIGKACGGSDANCGTGTDDDALASVGWDLGTCPNLAGGTCQNPLVDCGDVADCVQCGGERAVDQTVGLAYDDLNLSKLRPRDRALSARDRQEGVAFLQRGEQGIATV